MKTEEKKPVRCAIYTRKSTDEGLDSDFNTLDAQREAGEAYANSQKGEGWIILPKKYDDGGFSGGNMERPALKELLKDIENDLIDTVIVYKVDRLSRSLLDFAELIGTFDKHGVTFVSVTQAFSTTTSMGRLTLNILLSFAQFEREIIGERIRDKIAAAKKKGKHTGGMPILGYDIANSKLIINPSEAKTVTHIFRRFLILRSALLVAKELNKDSIKAKAWTTKKGKVHTGARWNKSSVHKLLTNRKYIGEVTHYGNIYPGEHEAIIELSIWKQVQKVFKENGHARARCTRSKTPSLLRGILKCGHCGGAMGITYSKSKGRLYRYYLCVTAGKNGYDSCPVRSVSAGMIEDLVSDKVCEILRSPEILAKAYAAVEEEDNPPDSTVFAEALQNINRVWDYLFPAEKARIFILLLERVTLNTDGIDISLKTGGISSLANELLVEEEEQAC